jgi:uncharacterized membrane protein
MEAILHAAANQITLALQAIAIVLVAIGSVRALAGIARSVLLSPRGAAAPRDVWLDYARWLVAALTFQLGADIVATSIAPTWEELGRLAAVAAIRTFLSYFLDREMERAAGPRPASRADAPAAAPPRAG